MPRKNIFGPSDVSNSIKVLTVLAYANKRAQIQPDGQFYSGIEDKEIGGLLRRMGAPLPEEDIASVLKNGVELNAILSEEKRIGKKIRIKKYDIAPHLERYYEDYMLDLGLLKVKLKKI
jgi:hypothetical protein